jgi:hypothetical protein
MKPAKVQNTYRLSVVRGHQARVTTLSSVVTVTTEILCCNKRQTTISPSRMQISSHNNKICNMIACFYIFIWKSYTYYLPPPDWPGNTRVITCYFFLYTKTTEAVRLNGRFQMQEGKNWILPKEMNANRSPNFKPFRSPRIDSKEPIPPGCVSWDENLSPAMGRGIDSRNRVWNWVAKLHRLAGRYDNPMPTWFLAPIAGLRLPSLIYQWRWTLYTSSGGGGDFFLNFFTEPERYFYCWHEILDVEKGQGRV